MKAFQVSTADGSNVYGVSIFQRTPVFVPILGSDFLFRKLTKCLRKWTLIFLQSLKSFSCDNII